MTDSQYDVFPRRSRLLSLESLMSFGMGSDPNGGTLSGVMCANQSGWMHGYKGCMEPGLMSCAGVRGPIPLIQSIADLVSQCFLVKVGNSTLFTTQLTFQSVLLRAMSKTALASPSYRLQRLVPQA